MSSPTRKAEFVCQCRQNNGATCGKPGELHVSISRDDSHVRVEWPLCDSCAGQLNGKLWRVTKIKTRTDYWKVGANHRERVRIRRKIQSWIARLSRQDPAERAALFAALAGSMGMPAVATMIEEIHLATNVAPGAAAAANQGAYRLAG